MVRRHDQVLLDDAAGSDGGASGETVFARGGPGALVEALASAARASGAEIRGGAEIVAVTSTDGRATGVALASGEEIVARAVVAGIDPKRLLTTLVDPVAIGPTLRWRASNIRTPGTAAKVNLVLDGLPDVPAAADDPRLLRGRILVGMTGIDAMERVFDRVQVRPDVADRPVVEATIPSLADPSLVDGAPDGTHVLRRTPNGSRTRLATAAGTSGARRSAMPSWPRWRPSCTGCPPGSAPARS